MTPSAATGGELAIRNVPDARGPLERSFEVAGERDALVGRELFAIWRIEAEAEFSIRASAPDRSKGARGVIAALDGSRHW